MRECKKRAEVKWEGERRKRDKRKRGRDSERYLTLNKKVVGTVHLLCLFLPVHQVLWSFHSHICGTFDGDCVWIHTASCHRRLELLPFGVLKRDNKENIALIKLHASEPSWWSNST